MPKQLNIKANFQLDTSMARSQLSGLQKQLTNLTTNSSFKLGVTEELTEATRVAQILKQTLNEATDIGTGKFDLSKFTAAMNQNMMTIDKFKQSLQSLGPEGQKAFNSLAATITSAQVPLQRTNKLTSEFFNTFSNTIRWQLTSQAIHKIASTIQQAYNYTQNLDKSLNRIQIVSGHSADYMKDFAVQANKAAKSLSASTLEYTNAALIYYQQGLSDKEVQKRTETTIKMAKVSGEAASTVSQQMTAVWNNFSNGLDNLERYADVMTALGATTASSSAEIAKGLEKFAGISKTIGLSYDYAASALATVTAQTRQSADSVGTAFKTLFSRLESLNLGETLDDGVTLNKYSQALMKVGVNVLDVNGQLKNMDTILDDLGSRWENLNQAQKVALAQTIGGVRNYTSLITLMDNWEKFQTNVTTSQLAEGTLQKQADIYAQSWEAAQQRVTTAAQGIYDTLISSDFFKTFNNLTANLLNSIGSIGQTLGTSGSLAGIGSLITLFFGSQLGRFIEDKSVNLLNNTNYGIDKQLEQQQQTIAEYKRDFMHSGLPEDAGRLDIIEAQQSAWSKYSEAKRYGYFSSDISAQAYYNQLVNATQISTEASNRLVDATVATQDNFIVQAQTQGRTLSLLNQIEQNQTNNQYYWDNFISSSIASQGRTLGQFQSFSETFNRDLQTFLSSASESTSELEALSRIKGNLSNYVDESGTFLLNNQFGKDFYSIFSGTGPIDKTEVRGLYEDYIRSVESQDIAGQVLADLKSSGYDISSELERQLRASINSGVSGYATEAYKNMDAVFRAASGKALLRNQEAQLPTGVEQDKTQLFNFGERNQRAMQDYAVQGKNTAEKSGTISFGNSVISTAQTLNALTMAGSSIKNFATSLNQGNATFGQFVTTTSSSLFALGQFNKAMNNSAAITGLFNNNLGRGLANKYAASGLLQNLGISEKLITRKNIGEGKIGEIQGLSQAGGTLASIGVMAAIAAIMAGIKVYQANNLEGRISTANETKIAANAEAKEDRQKYDQFLSLAQTQNDSINKLYGLQKGTAAYTAQLISNNSSARELISTYGLTGVEDYTIDKNGAISFSAEQIQNIQDKLLAKSLDSENRAQIAASQYTQLSIQKRIKELDKDQNLLNQQYEDEAITQSEYNKKSEEIEKQKTALNLEQQADYQTSLQAISALEENQTEARKLAIDLLGFNAENNIKQYEDSIAASTKLGNEYNSKFLGLWYKRESVLQQKYYELYGEIAPEGATKDWLANAISTKAGQKTINDQIQALAKTLDTSMISEFSNYSSVSKSTFDQLVNRGLKTKGYEGISQLVIGKQAESIDSLAAALLNNTNITNLNYLDLAQKIQDSNQLSIDQMNTLTNYINNFGVNFGQQTGQYIFEALTKNNTGLNEDLLNFLQTNNFDNSISGLSTLTDAISLKGYSGISNSLQTLKDTILLDIKDRGGLAQTLFKSSDFQDVFESLKTTLYETGDITAQNVQDLAKKNEIIGDYLKLNGGNAQAIADMAVMVASGQISISELTPAIENFVNLTSGAQGAQQAGLATLSEQDLSDSYSTLNKYYQNIGKAFYTASNNDMLYDAPLLEGLRSILTQEDWDKYQSIIYNGAFGSSTQDMLNAMKKEMPEAYAMLEALQGKKGKGAGGVNDAYYYLAQKGVFEEAGIEIDDNGRIHFNNKFDEKMGGNQVTVDNLREVLIEALTGEKGGFSLEYADRIASQMLGSMSASSIGAVLQTGGAIQGTKDLLELVSGDQAKGNFLTGDQLEALYDQYSDIFGLLKIGENGLEEVSKGEKGLSKEDWLDYISKEALKNGTAIINMPSNYSGSLSAEAIGNTLQQNSSNTINNTGIQAIIEAAVKSGITSYADFMQNDFGQVYQGASLNFEQLKNFYTDILGLSEETFKSNIKDLNKSGMGLNYTYRDVFGVSHNINSRDFTDNEKEGTATNQFLKAIEDVELKNSIQQAQQQQWIQEALSGEARDENGELIDATNTQAIYDYVRSQTEQAIEIAQQQELENDTIKSINDKYIEYTKDLNEAEVNQWNEVQQKGTVEEQINAAYEKARAEGGVHNLSPFEKAILTAVGEINESTGDLVDIGEADAETAAERAKAKQKINDEGQIVDEEGNVIELPSQQSVSQGLSSGSNGQGGQKGIDSQTRLNNWQIYQTFGIEGMVGMSREEQQQLLDDIANYNRKNGVPAANTYSPNNAAGQNNNVLTFAKGTKGHIAVTGELGPELRIKEDGSAELLGKKGREYTWVEPEDRIYTATQTASILGNNSIPALEGLAKGIQNYIPGYATDFGGSGVTSDQDSSGGGSGGGSKKDPRYDPNTLKIRDILERYYTILQQIDDIARELEHIGKVIDRSWGQERISGLKTQQKLLEKQYQAQQKYVEEIKSYLGTDKNALTTMMKEFVASYNKDNPNSKLTFNGAQFDSNGVLTNYREFVEKLVAQYNKNAAANAQNKEAQYKFQEQLKDIQKYTETLNLYEAELEKLYDLQTQKLDAMIQIISTRIQNEEELDNNDLLLINYQLDKVKKGAYDAADAIALIAEKSAYSQTSIERQMNGILDILGNYMDEGTIESMKELLLTDPAAFFEKWIELRDSADFKDLTTPEAQAIEQYMQGMVAALQEWRDNFEQIIDYMGDSIKEFAKDLDEELSEFDFFNEVMENYQNILNLTSRTTTGIDDAFMQGLSESMLNNSINKLKGARREQEAMARALAQANSVVDAALQAQAAYTGNDAEHIKELQREVDRAKDNAQKVNEQYEKSVNEFTNTWEAALDSISKNYEQAVQNATKAFEASFSPYYKTLDLLEAQFQRQRDLGDLYVDDYQRIHDLSKLNRDIEQSIIDTDSLKGKAKLRELQEEIIKLQEDGTELSEYDLEILDKKYKLELARQALEDAKNAKSVVRLSRDNNGNWGYVYTSNQDDVAEAEQNYEDAIRDMEEANQNYMDNLEEQLVSVQRDAMQQISALRLEDFDSEEAMLAEAQRIWDNAMEKAGFLTSQLQNVFGNNGYLGPFIEAMYGTNEHNLITDFSELPIFKLLGLDGSEGYLGTMNERLGTLVSSMNKAVSDMVEGQKEVWETAGYDASTAATTISEAFDNLSEQSEAQVELVESASERVETAFGKITDAIKEQIVDMAELTKIYERFLVAINEVLHFSNEYDPEHPEDFHINKIAENANLRALVNEFLFNGNTDALKEIPAFATGGYTGEWNNTGRLAILHQKELVLNANDTANLLNTMSIVKQLDNFASLISNGIGSLATPKLAAIGSDQLEQNVHISASFPNVVDHNEIEQAFDNLVNLASQYANKKHI